MNYQWHQYNVTQIRNEAISFMQKSFWIEDFLQSGSKFLKLAPNCYCQISDIERSKLQEKSEYFACRAADKFELLRIMEGQR